MSGKNVKLMGVVAVIIVICLLFSFLYMDNGPDERRDAQIGDYRIYAQIEEDSEGYRTQNLVTETIIGIENDKYIIQESGGISSMVFYADREYLYPEFPEENLRSEGITVDIPLLGERVCDVYAMEDSEGLSISYVDSETGDVLYEVGSYTVLSTDNVIQRILVSDSTTMQAPEYGSSTYHIDLIVGDYIAFQASTDLVDSFVITYTYQMANEDGTLTFYDDFREEYVTCTLEEFFAGGYTGEYTVVSTSLVESSYGPRLCEVRAYETDLGYTYTYVGVDDGICYGLQYSDADGNTTCSAALAYSNKICGDLEIVGQEDLTAGDRQMVLTIYSDPEGGVDYNLVVNQVQQVIDGEIFYETYEDGLYVDTLVGSYITEPVGSKVGSIVLHTVYGDLRCDMLMSQTNDGVTTYLYVYDGIVVYENRFTELGDGTFTHEERMLVVDTSIDGTDMTGGRTNLGYVEEGSWFDYNVYINSEPFNSISYDVVSVDGENAMVSVNGGDPTVISVFQLLNGYAEGIDVQLIGQSVIDTIWGDIVCDVYYLEAEYETYYYVGASDGVNYLTEYTVGEDLYSVYLEGSSTVF